MTLTENELATGMIVTEKWKIERKVREHNLSSLQNLWEWAIALHGRLLVPFVLIL